MTPTTEPEPLVCAVGDLLEDVVVRAEQAGIRGADVAATVERHRGGSAANTAAVVARLGGRARFIGPVGADDTGDRMLAALVASGVEHVGPRRGAPARSSSWSNPTANAPCSAIGARPRSSRTPTNIGSTTPRSSTFRTTRSPTRPTVARTGCSSPPATAVLIVSMDPSTSVLAAGAFGALVRAIEPDVVFCNADEAKAMGMDDDGLPGARIVVVKQGAQPVLLRGAVQAEVAVPAVARRDRHDRRGRRARRWIPPRVRARARRPVDAVRAGPGRGGVRRARARRRWLGDGMSISDRAAKSPTRSRPGTPVVALESTIFSPFGLPAPANEAALDRCIAAVRANGAVPAVTAVLDGRAARRTRSHRTRAHPERRREGCRARARRRDRRGAPVGVTTVSASLALAAAVGIDVFATGGIGGVHRGVERTGDVSADLGAIAAHPVVTVSSGAKAFLDLARTLEVLESASVPVLGWRTDEFPMFWCRSSGLPLPQRVEGAVEVADVARALRALGLRRGVLLAVPIPEQDAIDPDRDRSCHHRGDARERKRR